MSALSPDSTDGRAARGERTRAAVVDALLALIGEGDLRPTAARIASRAGVSPRSVFQHFEDMEALLAEASSAEIARIEAMHEPLPTTGNVEARIEALTAQKCRMFETFSAVRRAAMLEEPFSAVLQAGRDRMLAASRAELEAVFAIELTPLSRDDRREILAGLAVVTSWDGWEHLRARQGLSPAAARRVVHRVLETILSSHRARVDGLSPDRH